MSATTAAFLGSSHCGQCKWDGSNDIPALNANSNHVFADRINARYGLITFFARSTKFFGVE